MASLQALMIEQEEKATELDRIIATIKKAPQDRRNLEFYKSKSEELTKVWLDFNRTENIIRRDQTLPDDDPYILNNLHKSLGEKYSAVIKTIEVQIKKLTEVTKPLPAARSPETVLKNQNTPLQGLARRVTARIAALTRLLQTLTVIEDDQPLEFYTLNTDTIKGLWNQIQTLYDELWQHIEDLSTVGLDQTDYNKLEDLVQHMLIKLAVNTNKRKESVTYSTQSLHSSLPLPKIIIPHFNGDYLKWIQFYELFQEMVHKQPLPNVQKMWYLKTNLSGEASKVISHLALTEENYTTAWSLLYERYNNKRVLVATLIEKILNQPKVTTSPASIKALHDTTRECLLALTNLGIDTSSWDALIIQVLQKKLEHTIYIRFMQSIQSPKEVPKISELLSFLERQFESMESIGHREKSTVYQQPTKAITTVASEECNNNCKLCNSNNHRIHHCKQFIAMTEYDRLKWVQQQALCVNCFKANHSAKSCPHGNCKKCNKKHNTLLHLPPKTQHMNTSSSPLQIANKKQHETTSNAVAISSASIASVSKNQSYVMLATAKVIIRAPNGISNEFRAILDSGSQVNIVSDRLIKKLSLSTTASPLCIDGVGRIQKTAHKRINVQMLSRHQDFSTNLEAFVLPSIIPAQPSHIIDISNWKIPKDIILADPKFHMPEKIDILLGAEFYFSLIQPATIKLSDNLPILQNTSLGWIVGGSIKQHNTSTSLTCAVFSDETSLEKTIEQLWRLDEVETNSKTLSPAENLCENHFNQHVGKNANGRFIVSLPFKENTAALGHSHQLAYNRFISLENRLHKNENMRREYIDFMREYEQLGHMERVNISNIPNPRYFIPHHCVLKSESTSTKLRVVFDASAKTSTGYSLNDLMYIGPTVQSDLFSILLRFRMPKFVFTTDIEKMYRQILINPEDHQYQLIIWREDPSLPINYYRLNTVTYGTRAAPYLATKCLQRIADENATRYPLGSQMLRNNFYVDDGLGGSDSLNLAMETQWQLQMILQEHGFVLKKWCSNNERLLKDIPHSDRVVNLDFEGNSSKTIKTLGVHWVPQDDQFRIKVKLNELQVISKRTVTSELAKLFDPLGLLAPVVVRAKIFIQQLWQHSLDWDEPLPESLRRTWESFQNELKTLDGLKIARHAFYGGIPAQTQLHIFADASERAYGAVVYIRSKLKDGKICVRLLCAKSRVAPVKQQTLPRLELCAAVIAAQLAHRVKTDLSLQNQAMFLWTDSEIVLSWINSQSSSYKTFVANRVSTIQSLTIPDQWRHINSKENPADILSRGVQPNKLTKNLLWFQGPIFLHGKEAAWPSKFSRQISQIDDIEMKRTSVAAAITTTDFIYRINHKNSFRTLQRILAYVLRFIKNTRMPVTNRPTHSSIVPRELDESLQVIVRTIQSSEFATDITQLRKGEMINKNSSLNSLTPFLDEEGILRVGGRLKHSNLQPHTKHPIILPYNDALARLLFIMIHEDNKHCGSTAMLNTIRQRFWPIKGKITARAVIQKCVRCTRARPLLYQQIMGNLPQHRITPARPFINSGVDYCGPFWIHYKIRGKRPTKAYVAVFCCFATKAVHLELVSDLSTEAFIGALKRFIARRGHCQNIYCDNATNFVGARNMLSEISETIHADKAQEAIISASSSKGIHFHFIPPRAPHFGGLWEAAVKSAKYLLVRSVSTESLTHEELETIIIEVEAILNSRPLIPLSNDPDNLEALTPGHFLIGEALTAQVDSRAENMKVSSLSHWKLVSKIKQQFWKRWSNEYLNELQQRHKWKTKTNNPKPGDMVIIKEDNLPTMKWPLGRIITVYAGDDGAVRVAEVKTATGIFKRSIHKLAPLHQENETEPAIEDKAVLEAQPSLANNQENDISPPKRFKPTGNFVALTFIISLLFIPIVLCNNLTVKQFQSDPGLYFEGIGTAKLNTAEWKLMVYYDLAPFSAELNSLSVGLETLQQLCPAIQRYPMCKILTNNLIQIKNELYEEDDLISHRRTKRSPFNIVGNIARSLFGVLDSDYAEDISRTINTAKIDQEHIIKLLRNQTSIIDSTINIIKEDEINSQKKITELLKMVDQNKNELFKETSQSSNFQLVGLLSTHLTLAAINLQKIEAEIINVLTDAHNGKISPLLLSPHQLKKEMATIKAHLPPSYTLPITGDDNLIDLYNLMNAKGAVTKGEVLFEVKIPLVNQQSFELFKIVPVPTVKNNTLIAIKPDMSYFATDAHRDEYIPFTTDDISSCIMTRIKEYICKNKQSKFKRNLAVDPCEINIFNNRSTSNCNLNKIPGPAAWIQVDHLNKWIFATTMDIESSMVCGKETTMFTIKNTGLIEIGPDCVIKNNLVTIQGHFGLSKTIHTSYVKLKPLELISKPEEIEKIFNTTTHHFHAQVDQLTNLQRQLHEANLEHLPEIINSNSQHHHAVSYTALLLCVIILLSLLIWNVRKKQVQTYENPPRPACRSRPPTTTTSRA